MKKIRKRLAALLALLAGSASVPATAQDQEQTDAAAAPGGLEEVVVTAQRREENLQDVPIAITAFSEEALETHRIQSNVDLSGLAPNLTVVETSGGVSGVTYVMRGVVGANNSPGTDKGVSVYIDGVYVPNSVGSVFEMADIERIEVLKGPQGTLFGRNATGGAISVITHAPSGEFDVKQELTFGNFDQFRTKTRVDLPAMGPLSASVTYYRSQRDGDIRNLGGGTQWDYGPVSNGKYGIRTSPRRLGDSDTESVQAAAQLKLVDSLDIGYRFDYASRDFTDGGQGVAALGSVANGSGFVTGLYALQPDPSLLTPIGGKRPDAVNNAFTTPSTSKNTGHSLTATFDASDSLSFKNILAYRTVYVNSTSQIDGLGGLIDVGGFLGVPDSPVELVALSVGMKQESWSNETQVNYTHDRFNLIAGLYYYSDDLVNGGLFVQGKSGLNLPQTLAFLPMPDYVVRGPLSESTRVEAESKAVYAQGEIHLGPQLDLLLGMRQTEDEKTVLDSSGSDFVGKDDPFTWLVGLNFKPADDLLLYAKASTGYISGGRLGGRDFDPETARSYEVGMKGDFLDRSLRTNTSVFYVDYTDLQFPIFPGGVLQVLNAGKSRAWGLEFEGTLIPAEGLTLQANFGYTNFKFTEVDPSLGTVDTLLPERRPEMTSSLSAQYETTREVFGGHLLFHVDSQYRSSFDGIASPSTAEAKEALSIDSRWLLNGRVALKDIPIAGFRGQVALWGRNLTDDRSVTFASDLGLVYPVRYEAARTYGVDLTFQF